jgi:hypothetical protein
VIRTIPLWGQQEISQVSDEPLFENFKPSPPPATDPPSLKRATAGKARKKRQSSKAAPAQSIPAQQVAAAEEQNSSRHRGRRPASQVSTRQRKKRQPRPTVIPIGILPALAGMTADEASLLMSIIGSLQDAKKKSRTRIVAALGRVFGADQ